MILKSITPKNFGPFAADSTLNLDPEVTVLTGPNDVGKSLALRAIQILCTSTSATEQERNRERIKTSGVNWQDDSAMVCEASFEINEASMGMHFSKPLRSKDILRLSRRMNSTSNAESMTLIRGKEQSAADFKIRKWPSIITLPKREEFKDGLDLRSLTPTEKEFIRLGFGEQFNFEVYQNLDEFERSSIVADARNSLNEKLKRILPPSLGISFYFHEIAGKAEALGISILDEHKGFVRMGCRGTGVRQLIQVMGALLQINPALGHTIILYDEPETSLHADAQHALRRLLESLAAHPMIQVVYSTHSSAMINSFRPQSIRIIERENVDNKAVSVFRNEAFDKNFLIVRSSLGISPADSLLYAPITIIAEGKSEVCGIPAVLKKLAEYCPEIIDPKKLDILLPQIHILDGEGSSFEWMCDLAKSQGASPVVFLDGDKAKERSAFEKSHPNVPIIQLDERIEFEDLVPKESYFRALAERIDQPSTEISFDAFQKWEAQEKPNPKKMFTKRVGHWLFNIADTKIVKHSILLRAIELSEPTSIDSKPFIKLMQKIEEQISLL